MIKKVLPEITEREVFRLLDEHDSIEPLRIISERPIAEELIDAIYRTHRSQHRIKVTVLTRKDDLAAHRPVELPRQSSGAISTAPVRDRKLALELVKSYMTEKFLVPFSDELTKDEQRGLLAEVDSAADYEHLGIFTLHDQPAAVVWALPMDSLNIGITFHIGWVHIEKGLSTIEKMAAKIGLLEWLTNNRISSNITASIDLFNTPSRKAAARVGFKPMALTFTPMAN